MLKTFFSLIFNVFLCCKCILDVLGTRDDCCSIEYKHEDKEDLILRKVESSNFKIYVRILFVESARPDVLLLE